MLMPEEPMFSLAKCDCLLPYEEVIMTNIHDAKPT